MRDYCEVYLIRCQVDLHFLLGLQCHILDCKAISTLRLEKFEYFKSSIAKLCLTPADFSLLGR
jgi:hypothetical protein